ncbi:hypothetical protein PYW07_001928 [Mythimna separata]|uniref:Uncharacterized protein n=1 Tax=Mythimna separata TaxID=271217 RepID=A0AAD7YMH7_MYTSE|nr:hypothetical protein PYW07_001928 [Mythimna separata]
MSNKQVKFGEAKRLQRVNPLEEQHDSGGCQRALLLSSDDVDMMAVHSSRVRLINDLVSKSKDHHATREFASCYHGPTRHFEPPYSITSHTNREYAPETMQVIPAYPSLVPAPQWCPYYRQMPEQISETNLIVDRMSNCRCAECRSADCPVRSYGRFRPQRIKDNIMTFCDQWTMTPNLNDVSCGTPIPSAVNCPGVSDPHDATLPVGGRDNLGKLNNYKMSKPAPVPILKKGYAACPVNESRKQINQQEYDENELPRSISIEYFYAKKEKEKDNGSSCNHSTRKNLYNEGISDVVLKLPTVPKKGPRGSASPSPARSRARAPSPGSSVDIPHSHRSSRYHRHCAELSPVDSKPCALMPSPRTSPCKICSRNHAKQQQRNIKLPKKVLTSEKVADSCAVKTKAHYPKK